MLIISKPSLALLAFVAFLTDASAQQILNPSSFASGVTSCIGCTAGDLLGSGGSPPTVMDSGFAASILTAAAPFTTLCNPTGITALVQNCPAITVTAPLAINSSVLSITNMALIAANTLGIVNGATGQQLNIYGSYTDSSDGDWIAIGKSPGNLATIQTTKNGTGTAGNLQITAGSVLNLNSAAGEINMQIEGSLIAFFNLSGLYSYGSAGLLWNTDGGGNIGASGSSRPNNVYTAAAMVAGTNVQTLKAYNGNGAAAVPTCNSGAIGTYLYVSDGKSSPTLGSTYAAGDGATNQPLWCNGSGWLYIL